MIPEQAAMAGGAPKNAAKHIAAAFVRRQDPVGHQEGDGPQVVGNDPHGSVGRLLLTVLRTGPRRRSPPRAA